MEVLKIVDIIRKDVPLYYRNKYSAKAELNMPRGNRKTVDLVFAVEVTPISGKEYSIEELGEIDYPTIPIKKALLEEIKNYDREGLLP